MTKTFLTVLLFAAIASCSVNAAVKKHPQKKVLILGAGLSGIIAGKTLMDNGVDDFLILEGQDYIGGRIKQASVGSYNVEAGPNWIQFTDEKDTAPIWNLKKQTNLTGLYSHYNDIIIRNDTGANITDMTSFHKFGKIFEKVEGKQEERKKARKSPISARIGLALMGWKAKTAAQKLIEYFDIDMEMGKRAEMVPFSGLFERPTDYFITDSRGMWTLYKGISEKFVDKIKLNKTVTEVKYNSTFVQVTTSDGDIYTADYALCTFSTGVLSSDMVEFSPPFPEWKTEAILKMPMSFYNKIFLKFPRKFWDDKEYILLASTERRGYYPVLQDLERAGMFPNGSGVMLITTTAEEARRIEMQSFEKTKAEIVERLKRVYGPNISEPTDIYYHRWSLNPYIRGSFSDSTIGVSSTTFEHLAKNLGALYFSGEATSKDWFGYMQGSYITGEEKAKAIVKMMKCREAGKTDCSEDKNPNAATNSVAISVLLLLFSFMISLHLLY